MLARHTLTAEQTACESSFQLPTSLSRVPAQCSHASLLTTFCTSRLFTWLNESPPDGSIIFSLSQTANICPHQQLTLSFWLRWEDFENDSCNLQACMDSKCQIFTVTQGTTSHDNQFVYYSFLGPVPDGSTTMTISVSADGASAGRCVGFFLLFDDFALE